MQFDERELIERCRSGDDTAFAELVDRYKDLVYGLIYRMVPDRGVADDLSQEVFLKVHRGLPYFRGEARLSTWVFRIVQNVCLQARSGRRPDASLDSARQTAAREHGSIDGAFGRFEDRDRLDKALAQLPPNYRCWSSHYVAGYSTRRSPKREVPLGR